MFESDAAAGPRLLVAGEILPARLIVVGTPALVKLGVKAGLGARKSPV